MKWPQVVLTLSLLVPQLGAQAPAQPPAAPQPKVDRSPRPGVGDLMVAPQRIILSGQERSGELSLVNVGPRTATYRASFIQMDMAEDGTMKEYTEKRPGVRYADDLIRFSPRQVTLEPGTSQVIRFSLRKPANLADGEYRSHLVLRAVPDPDALAAPPPGDTPPQGFGIRLTPIYGVAIPFIVRHGTTQATLKLDSATIQEGPEPTLQTVVSRTGNQGAYFNYRVTFEPQDGSETLLLLHQKMVGIYDGLPRRRLMDVLPFPQHRARRGTLRVSLMDPDTQKPLAETRLELR